MFKDYRRLATRDIGLWTGVAFLGRLPVAMAPLALVFLARSRPGGYALGGILAAVYIAGEVVGAAAQGVFLRPERLRVHLVAGLAASGAAFLVAALWTAAPVVVTAGLIFVAGAAPAAFPGGMRGMLNAMVAEKDVPRALSMEGVLTEVIWISAPALVVVLSLQVAPTAPLWACALGALLAALLFPLLPVHTLPEADATPAAGRGRVLASAWPVYLTSAAAISLVAAAELVLPALLEQRGVPVGFAGVLLSAFSVVAALGAFSYGLRSWPGTSRTQSLVLLSATAVAVAGMALAPNRVLISVALLVAGFCQSVVMVTRNISLRERLPEAMQPAGYSMMYAVQGVGYSLTAVIASFVLARSTADVAVLCGVAVTVLLTVASAVAERRDRSATEPPARRQAEQSAHG
ncbi:MFS transporter [Couchioplanes azureus]|uniref:MFS transporter n=1 Tax=Couchioplanes caeruleus TaxID=56438 RepID=UPI00199D2314|nr:MFS transporter [Couchioplanes caeruleus]GGQ43769.1 ABC transporter permease [Couchioplanes caeruleus subsp. azureus]